MKSKGVLSSVLAVASVIGVCVTIFFCQKEAKEELEQPEQSEEIMTKAKHYKKTIISGSVTVLCIAGGHIISMIALSSAVGGLYFWKKKYKSLDEAVKDVTDSKLYKEIKTKVAKKALESEDKEVVKSKFVDDKLDKSDRIKVYEPESEQFIETTTERLLMAKNYLHVTYAGMGFTSVNHIIRILGGKPKDELKKDGWSLDIEDQTDIACYNGTYLADFDVDVVTDKDTNEPLCFCIFYNIPPMIYEDC